MLYFGNIILYFSGRAFGAKAKTKPGLMPGFCFNLSQSERCFALVKSQELLAEFDLGGSLDAKREADSYCLNSTSVAPWPP